MTGVQRREFECVKTQAEGITEAVAVNEVPEEILSQGHRIRVCTPTDSSSNPIIWYKLVVYKAYCVTAADQTVLLQYTDGIQVNGVSARRHAVWGHELEM